MISYKLTGEVVPKARPKINYKARTTYKCPKYRKWQDLNIKSLLKQGVPDEPLENVAIAIVFYGKHNRSKDLDNMAGSILDILTASDVLRDDNSICLRELNIRMEHSSEPPQTFVQIFPLL